MLAKCIHDTLFCGSGVPLPSIATSSAMTQSPRYRPSSTIFPKSVWIHRSSGESGVHVCKMYTQKQELTLFCGFDVVTPCPKIAIEVVKSICCPVKWMYNSFPGFRRDSGKFESKIIARGPHNNGCHSTNLKFLADLLKSAAEF
jgi:hypothetical protein